MYQGDGAVKQNKLSQFHELGPRRALCRPIPRQSPGWPGALRGTQAPPGQADPSHGPSLTHGPRQAPPTDPGICPAGAPGSLL